MSESDGTADKTVAVREEDAFDVAAAHEWLAARVDGLPADPPEVRQFPGGASNLTYLLRYPGRDLILRRPPAGHKAASAHDMRREYRVQAGLRPVFPYVPTMLAFCEDHAVLGGDFYVMEQLDGLILRRDLPPGLELGESRARELSTGLIDRLVELHQVDVSAAGLDDLGKGAGYVRRQVDGWIDRYGRARTENVPEFTRVIEWIRAHTPPDVAICLIHNDFRFDNVVLRGADDLRVAGVLDWEMATLGDPLMELGSTLSYWVQADDDEIFTATRRQPTHLPGMLTRTEVVEHYARRTGTPVDDWIFYEVFGLFRYAGIIQQLYYRYHHGQTTNERFADYWQFVCYLEARCERLLGLA
ncbi:phosphotransferase family protein [Amycolatopsis antarctica]|uniref:Phosphotransferase family protein n=1 Tax=Amycolatopsis antarctica TaxID=1854586 RepID=A0A263D000_9PSEU|nr:phosphotransferase family protein [Amycolatopsis antarctica]OZM71681.1 phosphotransferase family protein [Amycolatopsis antarctica]